MVEPEPDQRAARLEPGREAQPDRGVRRAPTEPEIEQRVVGRERADDRERLVRRQRQRFAARGEIQRRERAVLFERVAERESGVAGLAAREPALAEPVVR